MRRKKSGGRCGTADVRVAASLRGCDDTGRHASAHASPDPHRQPHGQRMTLAFLVPHAAFVVSPRCATVLTNVPPSPLDLRAYRGLQDHPQHLPRLQRVPRSFLIAGAAFVAFSYATTTCCPHRSTRAAGHIPNTTLTSPAPVAASLHRTHRTLAILSAVPPPLKTCPWHAP